jgi:hypothetical protein
MFSFAPVWLRAGTGYSFELSWADSSSCRTVSETSWAHNQPRVDAGLATCQNMTRTLWPPLSGSRAPQLARVYHRAGMDDKPVGCDGTAISGFDPAMPSGWLVLANYGGSSWLVQQVTRTPSDAQRDCGSADLQSTGMEEVAWKPAGVSYPPGSMIDVCRFTQFAAPGEHERDGWYWSLPWLRATNSAPRDTYLKLEYRVGDGAEPADFSAGPSASEMYGSANPAMPNICGCQHGDPVDSATGNLAESHRDIAVSARGVGLGSRARTTAAWLRVPHRRGRWAMAGARRGLTGSVRTRRPGRSRSASRTAARSRS